MNHENPFSDDSNGDDASSSASDRSFSQSKLAKVVESYLNYYADGSKHTAKAKRTDAKHFLDFLEKHQVVTSQDKLLVSHWDHSTTQSFVEHCLSQGEAPTTVSRRLATLKHMGRTLAERVSGFTNPAKEVKSPKVQNARPKALTLDQVREAMLKAQDRKEARNTFQRIRNEMLFIFLIETGLRADEVRLLRYGQLDEGLEWIQNVRTKGKKFRNVYVSSSLRPQLAEYLKDRRKQLSRFFGQLTVGEDKKLPLFISTYRVDPTDPDTFLMGAKSIWRAINQLSTDMKLHPHLLRHSFATDLLNSSQDVRLVAQALGHSDVRITMRYTERADRDLADALERKGQIDKD